MFHGLVDHPFREMQDAIQPGLKVIQATHLAVHQRPEIDAVQGRIAQAPMRPLEYISLIHHLRDEALPEGVRFGGRHPLFQKRPKKNGLARVGIPGPLIEGQRAQEFPVVLHFFKQRVRQKIVHHHARRIAGKARSEVPARFDRTALAAELNVGFRIFFQKLGRDADHRGLRPGDAQVA